MPIDIPPRNWVARYLPSFLQPYARLMRLDKPIGTWLLLLPCWWGIALASPRSPSLWLMLLFAAGAIVMRSAGCVINDLYDREFDRQVARTASRPLASGELEPWQAIILLLFLLFLGLCILLMLNTAAITIGAASLFLVFTYPLMKRITWWPQLFLGFTFNWGALVGWVQVAGAMERPGWWLYSAGIFWTLAYDTIYAHQDAADDRQAGVKSTALLFGKHSKFIVGVFYVIALLFLLAAGRTAGLGNGFYLLMIWAAFYIFEKWTKWRTQNAENCYQRFRCNRDFGMIVLLAIIAGKLF